MQLISAEIPGVASFSSGQTSDPIPEESRPGGRDGQLRSQVLSLNDFLKHDLRPAVEKRGPGCMRKCLGARKVKGKID